MTASISADPAIERPTVWWDDRGKHSTARAFITVFWPGQRKYGGELRFPVPKDVTAPTFVQTIDEMVGEVVERSHVWYAEARAELDRRSRV